MNNIFNRINKLKYDTWAKSDKEPNILYLNIADYRELCAACKGFWLPKTDKPAYLTGTPLEQKTDNVRLTQFALMKIVKRAGEMGCAFN